MAGKYATETTVSIQRSRAEIETVLQRYGASQFAYLMDTEANCAIFAFRIKRSQVRITLPMPDRSSREFTETPSRRYARSEKDAQAAWEQACKQRFRALLLIIKAKLEAVDCGISTLEREFLADTILPSGQTFGQWVAPQLEDIYANGKSLPPLITA